MSKIIIIDPDAQEVRLSSLSTESVAKVLGRGPKATHKLANGDLFKVRTGSDRGQPFTIGGSGPFHGRAVIVSKTCVNLSNMRPMIDTIRQMVDFEDESSYAAKTVSFAQVEQLDFWP